MRIHLSNNKANLELWENIIYIYLNYYKKLFVQYGLKINKIDW